MTRKVTSQEIAEREDTDEAADQDLGQDRQDGIEIETIEDEEAELQIDTTATGDTTEKDETDTEAEGLLLIQDLTKGVLEAEEVIEETGTETMIEETAIEIDTLMKIDVEEAEELVPEMEVKSLRIHKGHRREVILEVEAQVKEEKIEANLEEKDLDPDLPATAEKTQKDLEAPAPANAVKEIKKVVPKEKTTIMPPVSMKETVTFLKDLEIKVRQIKAIMKIKAESLLKTRMKTTSE